jgi:glyoxylase-like metal-dependent hydrolase (beta-lactamase superfamily II)
MTGRALVLASCALAVVASAGSGNRPAPTRTDVADGVYLFTTPGYGDVGLDGNSIAIVSRQGVLVFDSNGTPAAAAAVLAEIRTLTDQPVRYVVNSHWHWDHWYGTQVYKEAFPDVRVVAHHKTRELMTGPALAFNQPGLETQLPSYIRSLEKRLAAAESEAPPPADLPALRRLVADDRFFLEQKRAVRHVFPDVTFSDRLDLRLGERHIQVLHVDRAVTPGDAFLYLKDERVLIAGDLLVNPISFALSCYPSGWIRTLERLDTIDARVIVPGHGAPLHDRVLLRATLETFRELLRQGRDAKARGLDANQATEAIYPRLSGLMGTITGANAALAPAFKTQLVRWYLHRVCDELNGTLSDAIAPIPKG